jgi:hypothetical protein
LKPAGWNVVQRCEVLAVSLDDHPGELGATRAGSPMPGSTSVASTRRAGKPATWRSSLPLRIWRRRARSDSAERTTAPVAARLVRAFVPCSRTNGLGFGASGPIQTHSDQALEKLVFCRRSPSLVR